MHMMLLLFQMVIRVKRVRLVHPDYLGLLVYVAVVVM